MALKKLVDTREEKLIEKYTTGCLIKSTPANDIILKEHGDFVTAIGSKLEDYCKFSGGIPGGGCIGGPIPDGHWSTTITTDKGQDIKLTVTQMYTQPGPRIVQADATLEYKPGILKADVTVVREAITSSGLTHKL